MKFNPFQTRNKWQENNKFQMKKFEGGGGGYNLNRSWPWEYHDKILYNEIYRCIVNGVFLWQTLKDR